MAVSFVALSTLQTGTTTATITAPAGTAAGDAHFVIVANKLSSTVPSVPAGFTLLGSGVVGTGTDGVGTGPILMSVYWRELTAAATNTTVTLTGGNVFNASGFAYRKGTGDLWNPSCGFGSDTTSGTGFSAAVASLGYVNGDHAYYLGAVTSNTTRSTDTVTITGCTLAAVTGLQSGGSASGNAIYTWESRTNVTAGAQTGTATATATHAAATTGGVALVRASVVNGRTAPRTRIVAATRAAVI